MTNPDMATIRTIEDYREARTARLPLIDAILTYADSHEVSLFDATAFVLGIRPTSQDRIDILDKLSKEALHRSALVQSRDNVGM